MLTLCHADCCSGAGGSARIASCCFLLLSQHRPEWSSLKAQRYQVHALTSAMRAVVVLLRVLVTLLVLVLVLTRGPSR
jgi:hypothetical protein